MARERKLAKVAAGDLVQRGLINNRDVEISGGAWVYFDYIKGGKKVDVGKNKMVAFQVVLTAMDDAAIVEEARWKIGDDRFYEPDGPSLYAAGDSDGAASKNSNFGIFMASLDAAGLPKEIQEKLAEDASALDGLKGHLVRQKVERGGTDSTGKEMKDSEVPIFTSIIALPGAKATPKKSGKGSKAAPKAAAAADDSDSGDISADDAADFILTAVKQNGDEVDAAALPGMVMSVMIAESVPLERRKAIRDWVRDQGEDLAIDGIAFGGGKFALTE